MEVPKTVYRAPWMGGALALGAGVGSAFLTSYDTDQWEKNPANTSGTPVPPLGFGTDRNLWLGLGLTAAGLLGHAVEWPHPDVTTGLFNPGVLLLGQRVTLGLAQRGNAGYIQPAPTSAAGTARVAGPAANHGLPAGRQHVGAAPYREVSIPGIL
jgi:hypothetical protein